VLATESALSTTELEDLLVDARRATRALVADLTDEQMLGPRLRIVNPPLWEIGHLAWFQEKWTLRHLRGLPPSHADADALYDSAAVPHATRWDLPLPARAATLARLQETLDSVLGYLRTEPLTDAARYFHQLAVFHEDMHAEALGYTRQTHGYAAPSLPDALPSTAAGSESGGGPLPGDVAVPGGTFLLGATPDDGFVFDNEKWAHPIAVAPFRIARAAVTNAEFAAFVEDGGYRQARWWSAAGWRWRQEAAAEQPVYWQRAPGGGWRVRQFDAWVPLPPHRPVLHVSWYEAEAYCNWAGRRLPTEAEWEMAAAAEPASGGAWRKRRFPWGDEAPTPARANLDWRRGGCVDVGALPAGDSYFGCRQMLGNVWEWTASAFGPYPGFVVDPYQEYSRPWFGNHQVLRGGGWATRGRLIRNTWRNFYPPDRRDVWAGFRTCAREAAGR
jgi:gamma-glutamyl hercynylcysteine S-oxide synthase